MLNTNKIKLFEDFSAGEITRPEQNVAPAAKTQTDSIAVDKTDGAQIRAEIIKDVDAILTNLETLSTRIQENLNELKADVEAGVADEDILEALVSINEAGGEVSKKLMDVIWYKPKAKKAMDKVNKIKQNAVAIDIAAKGLDGSDAKEKAKKDALKLKADSAKKKADDLEKAVRDKFSDRSEVVKKAIANKDIEGRLDAIKQETGMSDDPKKKAELKNQMGELQTQLKKEEEAIKQIEKDVDPVEVDNAKQEMKDHQEAIKALKKDGWKDGGLPKDKEGETKTMTGPDGDKQIFHKVGKAPEKAAPKKDDTTAAAPKKDDTKKDDTKVDDTKKDDTKVDDTKTDDTKVDDTKTDDTKVDDTKTDDTKKDDSKKDDSKKNESNLYEGMSIAQKFKALL